MLNLRFSAGHATGISGHSVGRGCGACPADVTAGLRSRYQTGPLVKRYHECFLVRSCLTVGPRRIESCVGQTLCGKDFYLSMRNQYLY
jgi:hypothetical protein